MLLRIIWEITKYLVKKYTKKIILEIKTKSKFIFYNTKPFILEKYKKIVEIINDTYEKINTNIIEYLKSIEKPTRYFIVFWAFFTIFFVFHYFIMFTSYIVNFYELKYTKEKLVYETKNRKVEIALVKEKVDILYKYIKNSFPSIDYNYKKAIDNAFDNPSEINSLPEDLLSLFFYENKIKPHGLKNYILRIPNTIYPIDALKGYVTSKNFEFGCIHPFEGLHTACDINNTEKAQVYAVYEGEIHKAYFDVKGGNTVELKFNMKINGETKYFFVRYRHVDNIQVSVGDKVKKGQVIASISNTGEWALGRHLHFECWELINEKWTNINPFMNSTYGNEWVDKL